MWSPSHGGVRSLAWRLSTRLGATAPPSQMCRLTARLPHGLSSRPITPWSSLPPAGTRSASTAAFAVVLHGEIRGRNAYSTANPPGDDGEAAAPVSPNMEHLLIPQWSKPRFLQADLKKELLVNKEQRIQEFGEEKNLFETITESHARSNYMLSLQELRSLPHFVRHNAYGVGTMHLYIKAMVKDWALKKWGSAEALREQKRLRQQVKTRRVSRAQGKFNFSLRLGSGRMQGDGHVTGLKAVYTALAGNVLVTASKMVGYFLTGSASMLSETLHSCADCTNQALLAYGLIKSRKRADAKHPYGYVSEQYVWSLVSGVGVFFLGCGLSLYHGFASIVHPPDLVNENVPIALSILGINFALETWSMRVALGEMRKEAEKANMTVKDYIFKAPDPMNIGVFLEDSAALMGIVFAAAGMGLASYMHMPLFDAVGTIGVGTMLGTLAAFLIKRNLDLLTLKSAPNDRTQMVVDYLMRDEAVLSVHDVKTIQIGPGLARFKAEIHYSPVFIASKYLDAHSNLQHIHAELSQAKTEEEVRALLLRYSSHFYSTLAHEVARLEAEIRKTFPEFKFLGLEVL